MAFALNPAGNLCKTGAFGYNPLAMDSIGLIREFLEERLAVAGERVVPEALLADLGVDSLMLLELMFAFEDRFEIKLPSNLATPKTVGEVVATMDGLIAAQAA